MSSLTPMMQQYINIKDKNKDSILFFRLGDFYEMFFEDAKVASRELEITLTSRDCGLAEKAPMCGVPFHSADSYVSRLINKGYKVAICEQVEDASLAKGLVKREVIKIITPGTITDSIMLDEKKNNYLMSIYNIKESYGVAIVDITTGEFKATQITGDNAILKLFNEISKFCPKEIVINSCLYSDEAFKEQVKKRFNIYISEFKYEFDKTLELSINASHFLAEYIEQTQKTSLTHIEDVSFYNIEEFMLIDMSTRRNLELTETMREKSKRGSLLWVLDKTITSMGGRLIRKWVDQPLIYIKDIEDRLDAVNEFINKYIIRMELRELLRRVYDIERLVSKVSLGNVNPRDFISLKTSIGQLPYIKGLIKDLITPLNTKIKEGIDELVDVYELINNSINDEPPIAVKEGGIIKLGYNNEVDKLRNATKEGKNWIAALETAEREKTGIKNLKIGFNRVFGYYIEVTKSYFHLVPETYIRKQTLSNCERYITKELKEIEDTILGAEEKVIELEYQIFLDIKNNVAQSIDRIRTTANNIAYIDVISCLAEIAERESYCRPIISTDGEINVIDGRHPVVEKMLDSDSFVPNDTLLNLNESRFSIITGPNMAGKSTFMRQVALIVLMAQIGSFVPAASAKIGICDRIFTRVGASDDLASGQSTFMVEMSEVANILKNATQNSLLILDEIGRGTSTFDGLSIAWSVIEFICNKSNLGSRTLFATHYHELTELEGKISGIKNYCIEVNKNGEDIMFLRKIIRGGADDSYGIQVAKLAGVPIVVIERAKEILKELEDADLTKYEFKIRKSKRPIKGQVDLFSLDIQKNNDSEIIEKLRSVKLDRITPIDALNILNDLMQKIS